MTNIYTAEIPRQEELDSNTIYYAYVYLREHTSKNGISGSPYYVGKGKGNRAYKKGRREIGKPKSKSNIIILKENLIETDAYAWEELLIVWLGRINLGTGCLRNKSDGGEGPSGRVATTKNKTYEEIYGEEKAKELRKMRSDHFLSDQHPSRGKHAWNYGLTTQNDDRITHAPIKGKTFIEFHGEEKAIKIIDLIGEKSRAQERICCLVCKNEMRKSNFIQWHGDKCKPNRKYSIY